MADNADLTPAPTTRLSKEMRRAVIEMFARGYSVRHIKRYLAENGCKPSETLLMRIAMQNSGDIEQARKDIASMALTSGLASKEERLSRLNLVAESWEDRAHVDAKAANIYLKTLNQIQSEVEPLGLGVSDPQNDPWGRLLTNLKDLARSNRESKLLDPTPFTLPSKAEAPPILKSGTAPNE